jgi:2-iminobutanoate/2-iminopropanoate deaminase
MPQIISHFKNVFMFAIAMSSISACGSTKIRSVNRSQNAYAHAVEVVNSSRLAFVSGQIPVSDDDLGPPSDFQSQCRTVWDNIEKQLDACGMQLTDIVKVTTFLVDRKYREENYKVRKEVLNDHYPAVTVIIADIYDEAWLVEIEVIAAR